MIDDAMIYGPLSTVGIGLITLNRPKALNALSWPMVRSVGHPEICWPGNDPCGVCGGDSRAARQAHQAPRESFLCAGVTSGFFHQAALADRSGAGDLLYGGVHPQPPDSQLPKPHLAFMDGIVMGWDGNQSGASLRIVTPEHTKMAMPETGIGLFPDVGGGYFLSRCPGHVGEYLALTGNTINGAQAVAWGLADVCVPAANLHALWGALQAQRFAGTVAELDCYKTNSCVSKYYGAIETHLIKVLAAFSCDRVSAILTTLDAQGTGQRAKWQPRCASAARDAARGAGAGASRSRHVTGGRFAHGA